MHACELAQALEIPEVLVPVAPDVTSALGALLAHVVHDRAAARNEVVAITTTSALPSSAIRRSPRLHGPRTSIRSRPARMGATLSFTCPTPESDTRMPGRGCGST